MSILRRKGKQFKDRRGVGKDKATRFNYELLSGDIQTLLQVFHDEANGGEVSCCNRSSFTKYHSSFTFGFLVLQKVPLTILLTFDAFRLDNRYNSAAAEEDALSLPNIG